MNDEDVVGFSFVYLRVLRGKALKLGSPGHAPFDNLPSPHVLSDFCPASPSNTCLSTKMLAIFAPPSEVR